MTFYQWRIVANGSASAWGELSEETFHSYKKVGFFGKGLGKNTTFEGRIIKTSDAEITLVED